MQFDEAIRAAIDSGHCPDCGHRGFVFGPMGGASTNIECGNVNCLARFNVARGPLSSYVLFAERIAKRSEGGAGNWGYPNEE